MIQSQTILRVSDNSGAKKIRCIKVLGGFKRKTVSVGDLFVGSIQVVKQHKKKKVKVKEGEVCQALVLRTKVKTFRKNFSRYYCLENVAGLMLNKTKPIATRVLGPVSKELRTSKFMKIASISSGFI